MTPHLSQLSRLSVSLAAFALLGSVVALAQSELPETARSTADSTSRAVRARKVEVQQRLMEADSIVRAQGGSRGDMARIYLTWDAPYGQRRARSTHTARCGEADSTRGDTLYLSCLLGRPSRGFNAFTAELRVHAAIGDTLGDWWRMERGAANAGSVVVEYGPTPVLPGRQPWATAGRGAALLQRRAGETQLRLIYAVPFDEGVPARGDSIYTLGRVIFKHRRKLAGCERPVCIEWTSATLAYGLRDEPEVTMGERFVAWNSPDGSVCAPFRGRAATRAWKPTPR